MKRVDPEAYCIRCGEGYGPFEETCTNCGFNPIDKGEDEAAQRKAESDFSDWQNSGRDGE